MLSIVRVHLNLKYSRFDLGIVEHLSQHRCSQVANTNVLDKTILNELFHGVPGLLEGHACVELHLGLSGRWVEDPFGWVTGGNGDVWHRNREVNQVEIKLLDSEVGKSLLASFFDMLWPVESVPKF